jgi:hypothetical protein
MRLVFRALELAKKLAGVVGGLMCLALVVTGVMAITGETSFPGPFNGGQPVSFGRYAIETGSMLLGAFVVWRAALAVQAVVVARQWNRLSEDEREAILARAEA